MLPRTSEAGIGSMGGGGSSTERRAVFGGRVTMAIVLDEASPEAPCTVLGLLPGPISAWWPDAELPNVR